MFTLIEKKINTCSMERN